MQLPIWQATSTGPVDITISLSGEAQGWFRLTDNGAVVLREIAGQDATGTCHIRVQPTLDQYFTLQVLCQSGADSVTVSARVAQSGGLILPCYGDDGSVANKKAGAGYDVVDLGSVTPAKNQSFDFGLWPAGEGQ